ncbi:MAG TPA: NAD(+)/NADH kinase [Actinomycetota bacterium]|nr:NAD(+)/NADH kinase [Actinomycetota bacterium]
MSRVAFVVHEGRASAVETAEKLRQGLGEEGVATEFARGPDEVRENPPDLIVSVGGDGTFLRAARVAAEADCPVLGVKVGRLGFLTEIEPGPGALELVRSALEGRSRVEERLAVMAESENGTSFPAQWAMNEIMVEKWTRHRLVRLAVHVDSEYVTTFSADGVIVATPTGSTAYSFSARGPIVSPRVECLILTPIAAHMVFDRSFVLGAEQVVVLEVVGDEPGVLSADGREGIELPVGSRVRILAAPRPARLVAKDDGPGFLTRVRDKFDLPGDPPEVGGPM